MLSRLSPSVYPEYARIYRLMTGKCVESNYRRVLATSVLSVCDDDDEHELVTLKTPDGIVQVVFKNSKD